MTNLNDDYEDQEEQLGKRFEDLCVDLCIESTVKEEAWDKYKEVSTNYCIDGDQLQWLVCALYECVRKSTTDNINSLDNTYVSLARLLSVSKMSFVQFFHRISKWADMVDMNEELRDRIERIESQFSVSAVIFDKYITGFYEIFQKIDESHGGQSMEEKFKVLCTDEELFRFTWLLYIKIKTNFPAICGDIILSFQLLLCTLDWIASNALISKSKQLFNSSFRGLPSDFHNRNWKAPERFPTVLKFICESNDMNYIDCKSTRDSFFRNYIEKLLEKEVIKGRETKEDNVLSSVNFEFNSRGIMNLYGEYMMASGDFDERIYLNPNALEEIGSVNSRANEMMLSSDLTPSAMRYMQEVINCGAVPGSVDTRKATAKPCAGKHNTVASGVVSRLNGGVSFNNYDSRVINSNYLIALLSKRQAYASEELTGMLQTHCFYSPMEDIITRLDKLSLLFLSAYNGKFIDYKTDLRILFQKKQTDPSLQRCQTTHKIYYYALEMILKSEISKIELRYKMRSRNSEAGEIKLNNIDISALLKKDEFHRALYAICVEIVLICSDSSKHFPWVLEVLELQAVHFYKIVEIFMRCVDLPREMVKYFSQVSENLVDSYSWRSDSTLWDSLARSGKAPSIDEVTPPERIEQSFKQGNKKLIVESNRERTVTKSSMITGRRLGTSAPLNQNIQNSQGSFRHEDDESARAAAQLLSANDDEKQENVEIETSHKLMYFLSSLRLRDICDRLHISRDLMCKIWTTFEHIITEETHLLKDRCIDQVILCCIFAVTRVASSRNLAFHEILQMYRMQPQSTREIYRSVLIESVKTNTGITTGGLPTDCKTNVHTSPGGTQRLIRTKEVRDDITRFYNHVFLPTVHNYVKRFLINYLMSGSNVSVSLTGPNSNLSKSSSQPQLNQPHLSPMPIRNNFDQILGSTSRRISNNKNIFVSPAKTQITMSPKRVTFTVNSSPSKELRDINAIIANAANKVKTGLSFNSTKRSEPTFFSSQSNISVLDRSGGGGGIQAAKRLRFDQ
uniref:Rb-like protein n=1 Tax=Schmidtea mediterranea TaxID=79327 RepID=D2DJU6_SCHMD|nr:rb-like protein [Schmidtea mediterranea]